MADFFFQNSSLSRKRFDTAIWTIKLSFLSIGIISTVLLLKLAIPYSLNLFISTLPRLWISVRSWFSPPYLYILVNFIIIGIVASSTFQHKLSVSVSVSKKKNSKEDETEIENRTRPQKQSDFDTVIDSSSIKTSSEIWAENEQIVSDYGEKSLVLAKKSVESETSCLTDSNDITEQKPSVSARFAVKKSTETQLRLGRSMAQSAKPSNPLGIGIAKPKKHNDTLDATWKAITEGKGKPLTRHLRKSDTWNVPPRVIEPEPDLKPHAAAAATATAARRELRKSETFNDGASSGSGSGSASSRAGGGRGGFMREKSLSQDELNRRVEAFIKKVNDDIRLQRQESYQRYVEMVNRGVY